MAGRPLLPACKSPFLLRVASCCGFWPLSSGFYNRHSSDGWPSLPESASTACFGSKRILSNSSSLLLSKTELFGVRSVRSSSILNALTRRRSFCSGDLVQVKSLSISGSPLPSNVVFYGNAVQETGGAYSSVPGTVEDTVSGERSPELAKSSVIYKSSSRKSRKMCYYHSQGLCTMLEDPVHMAKFSHEFPDLSTREQDLKKVKAQPFDYFLVLDLEGMVEILEFPVVMIDAKTLQVVDKFHRFVRPVKMTQERIVDYIHNKYGRWGLDRVWHDTATPFTEVLPVFERWLESHGLWDPQIVDGRMKTAAFVTCGNWDLKTKIPEQCSTSEIDLPAYFNEWINLKDIFFNFYKFKATGMLKMMKGLKLPMVGTHHVGLDDAYNIARVLQRMIAHGAFIQITAKRKTDDSKAVKFTFRFRIK